jgi:putative flippase GtrA
MLTGRAIRFVMTGGLTTVVSYVCTMLLFRVMSLTPAVVIAWLLTVAVGFTVNRRFTFGIVGREKRGQDFGLFAVGALLQLAIGLTGYWVTIGKLGLDKSLAFLIVLVLNTSFGFAFQSLVTFRRVGRGAIPS